MLVFRSARVWKDQIHGWTTERFRIVWDIVIWFVLLVAGSYMSFTMALRGVFGREYYDPRTGKPVGTDDDPDG
jgi:hypothetical protein